MKPLSIDQALGLYLATTKAVEEAQNDVQKARAALLESACRDTVPTEAVGSGYHYVVEVKGRTINMPARVLHSSAMVISLLKTWYALGEHTSDEITIYRIDAKGKYNFWSASEFTECGGPCDDGS